MDGGRGGGRGKGKKKAARQKKAAAAAAAAVASHKKPASSQAVAAAPSGAAEAKNPAATHPQNQVKKRKRVKASSVGKKQAVEKQQVQVQDAGASKSKSPVMSPRAVTVLTPVTGVAKPHVVSLTGGKKKRKRRAVLSEAASAEAAGSEAQAATVATPKEGQPTGVKQSPATLKTQQMKKHTGVINLSVSSPLKAASIKAMTLIATSPKRKIAKIGHAAPSVHTKQVQKATASSGASPKIEVAASPRKTAKTVKAKLAEVPAGSSGSKSTTAASPQGLDPAPAKNLQTKADASQKREIVTVVNIPAPAAPSLKTVKPTPVVPKRKFTKPAEVPQTTKVPEQLQQSSQQVEKNKFDKVPIAVPATIEVATTPRKNAKKRKANVAPQPAKVDIPHPSTSPVLRPPVISTTGPSPQQEAQQESASVSKSAPSATESSPAPVKKKTAASTELRIQSIGLKRKISASQGSVKVIAENSEPPTKRKALSKENQMAAVQAESRKASLHGRCPTDVKAATTKGTNGSSSAAIQITNSQQAPPATAKQPHSAKASIELESKSKEVNVAASGGAIPLASSATACAVSQVTAASSTKKLTVIQKSTVKQEESVKSTFDNKTSCLAEVQPPVPSKRSSPIVEQRTQRREPIVKVEVSTSSTDVSSHGDPVARHAGKIDPHLRTEIPSEAPTKTEKVGIIMDSHAYVNKMMRGELESNATGSQADVCHAKLTEQKILLPPRPQNAWGASFGMMAPVQSTPSLPRRLSTTPLSSWFLSKGTANFVKQVHFSDDDDDSDDDDSDANDANQSGPVSALSIGQGGIVAASSKKGKTLSSKKNAFLESLTQQSNWRTWYGNVDLQNLLDPPLAHIPDNLRTHEVTPLKLPEAHAEIEGTTRGKKTDELEKLEADIRREKRRGSAFGDQLLMMLQGKTVSGKLLEEEYSQMVHQT